MPDTPADLSAARDARLLAGAQRGDQESFERLLVAHRGLLEFHARRFFLPGGDKQDVLQEARIGFAKAVRCYRGGRGSSFRSFASLCVGRQLAGALTAAQREKHRPLSEAARGEQAQRAWGALPAREDPLDRALAGERLAELRSDAAQLSALERRVLAEALVGFSSGEAARRLGVRPKSADNALQRARRKLDTGASERLAS